MRFAQQVSCAHVRGAPLTLRLFARCQAGRRLGAGYSSLPLRSRGALGVTAATVGRARGGPRFTPSFFFSPPSVRLQLAATAVLLAPSETVDASADVLHAPSYPWPNNKPWQSFDAAR